MKLELDERLLEAVLKGTALGLQMTGLNPPAVGASRLFNAIRPIAVIVGMVGRNNGTVTLNLTERTMLYLTGKLLGEEQKGPTEDNLDAIMEIGNMIASHIKDNLRGSAFDVQAISVPSLILGASYTVHYSRGLSTLSVDFELQEIPVTYYLDRVFSVTISLMQKMGAGK
jgi:CheY-specific phosphatase CheX